jgi:hypothetical protein
MTANSSSSTNEVPLNIAVCKLKDRCSPARGTRRSDALEQLALPFIRPYDAAALRVGRQSQRLAELLLSVPLWWGTMSGLSPSAPAHSFALVGRQHSADEFRLAGIAQSTVLHRNCVADRAYNASLSGWMLSKPVLIGIWSWLRASSDGIPTTSDIRPRAREFRYSTCEL